MVNIGHQISVIRPPSSFAVEVDRMTESEWNTLLGQFSDASIYQTWAYGAVCWGENQLSHLVLRQAGEPIAMAQLRIVRVPVINCGVAYLRWGPVCIPLGTEWSLNIFRHAMHAIADEYVSRRRLLLRVVSQQFTQDSEAAECCEVYHELGLQLDRNVKPYHTFRLDLSQPLDAIRKGFDGKWRNQLNSAERNSLTISEGTGDELFEQFLVLYQEMMARKQFDTTVDTNEFRRIQQRLPDSQKMLILIAKKDGQPMTGLIGSVTGDIGIYLLGATSTQGMKTKGAYLLQWRMIQRLKERGCRWYDLGGINRETNPGVYHFKEGLGGQDVSGLGRFTLSMGVLSAAGVIVGECLRSLWSSVRNR